LTLKVKAKVKTKAKDLTFKTKENNRRDSYVRVKQTETIQTTWHSTDKINTNRTGSNNKHHKPQSRLLLTRISVK